MIDEQGIRSRPATYLRDRSFSRPFAGPRFERTSRITSEREASELARENRELKEQLESLAAQNRDLERQVRTMRQTLSELLRESRSPASPAHPRNDEWIAVSEVLAGIDSEQTQALGSILDGSMASVGDVISRIGPEKASALFLSLGYCKVISLTGEVISITPFGASLVRALQAVPASGGAGE